MTMTETTRSAPRRAVRHRLHRAAGARDGAAGLVPAEPAAGDRAGAAVRDHARRPTLQYLIVSTSSNGDPINCNCPGTYETRRRSSTRRRSEVEKMTVTLGGKTLRRRAALGRPVGDERDGRQHRPAQVGGAGPHRVLPPHDRRDRPRRSAEGDEADGDDHRQRDGRLRLREAPGPLLRHGAGGADRARRARQLAASWSASRAARCRRSRRPSSSSC